MERNTMIKDLALADVRIDGNTQQRPIDDNVVLRYQALIADGVEFPPVEVVFDGHNYWLYNGFHRLHSHRKLGKKYIKADIFEGIKRYKMA